MAQPSSSQAIATLYQEQSSWLKNWLQNRLGCSQQAADLAQDAFVRLLRRDAPMGDQPRALLTHIAKGLLVDHWRHQAVEKAYLEAIVHLPDDEVPSPEHSLIIIEALVRIDAMLDTLPAQTRELFLLAQLDGLTLKQISQQTGTPVITVRRHIQRALMACMALV